MTDEELVSAILKGNSHLYSELVDRYKDRIHNMAYRFTNSLSDSQDLSQEIFLLIYRNLPVFNRQCSLSTWIYRVSVNRCLDWCRKYKKEKQRRLDLKDTDESRESLLDRIPSTADTPEEALLQKEQRGALHHAISLLPDKYKTVIIMYHFQNLSYKEIGDILGLSVRTVETQLYRAKQKLKALLTHQEGGKQSWSVKEYKLI